MEAGEWILGIIGAIAGLGGLALGLVSLSIARGARQDAQTSNALAKQGNESAIDAVRKAGEANRIAEDANDLAGDANVVARRALAVAEDSVEYAWVLKVDDDGTARVVNDGAHDAHHVTAVVDVRSNRVADATAEHIPAFGELRLDVTTALEEHFEEVRKNPAYRGSNNRDIFIMPSEGAAVSTTFRASIMWRTVEDVPRHTTVNEIVRHRMGFEGMRRLDTAAG
ncbi:hypothetical protein LCL87_03545 [Rhodococcus hoagii]|nr:hypothetical protein [Prescottella equi]